MSQFSSDPFFFGTRKKDSFKRFSTKNSALQSLFYDFLLFEVEKWKRSSSLKEG